MNTATGSASDLALAYILEATGGEGVNVDALHHFLDVVRNIEASEHLSTNEKAERFFEETNRLLVNAGIPATQRVPVDRQLRLLDGLRTALLPPAA